MKSFPIYLILFLIVISFPGTAFSQLVLGQYEDEAPVRTWNKLGISTASSLSMGNTLFTLASDCSVALTNPALLTRLSRFTFTISSSYSTASLFKYSIVNTGVLATEKNQSVDLYAIDFLGASMSFNGWALALNFGILEHYDRPAIESRYVEGEILFHQMNFRQKGELKSINLALSREISKGVSLGFGINYVTGNFEKSIIEELYWLDITISDEKNQDIDGFYFNGGLVADLSDRLTISAMFRTPYERKADSKSLLRYYSPQGNTDIKIEASANSIYKQPLALGLGLSYKLMNNFLMVSEFSFFNWSKYEVNFFGEDMKRKFKNTVRISAGLEYSSSFRMFNKEGKVPLRLGLCYDPQPMKEPNSYYLIFSLGTGLHWENFSLDLGVHTGGETGSGDELTSRRVMLSLGFRI